MEMTAPPGEYKLEITLRDRISNRSFSRILEVRVPEFWDNVYSFSSPLFCGVTGDFPVPEKFIKHGMAVLPKVSRSYGAMQEEVPIYLEVYTPGGVVTELSLIARSFHRYQNHTREDTLRFVPSPSNVTPVLLDIPLSEFVPGECQLTLTLTDGERALTGEVEAVYQVEWSLASMLGHDWNQVVDQLVHIAEPKKIKALRDAPEDKRLEMFNAFWKGKDPSPDTPENEWKNEFYRRIRFADVHYTNPYRRGWQTDFGMVYIKYGEPDQVERYPFELGSKPYEIWYYYAQDRKFVFEDTKGNGDYQLQYPYDGRYRSGG
jgi:GWxTD domain-containing protein